MKKIIFIWLLFFSVNCYALELVRQKNVATVIMFPLIDSVITTALKSGASGLDSEIDQWSDSGDNPDGFVDCTNEAIERDSTGQYYLVLTAGEMDADYISIQIQSSDALTQTILISTTNDVRTNKLDHLVLVADNDDVTNDSIMGKIASVDGDWSNFDKADHSLEAIRIQGDSAWLTGTAAATANTADADGDDVQDGSVTANLITDTYTDNGVKWTIADNDGTGIDVRMTFTLGTDKTASAISLNGYFDGGPNRYANVFAWNYMTTAFDQLSDAGSRLDNESSDNNYGPYILLPDHQQSSDGEVIVRFFSDNSNSGDDLYLDQVLISAIGTGGFTLDDIADAVASHDVTNHEDHKSLGFHVSISVIDTYVVTTEDTAISFTCSSLPAVTNYYQYHRIRVHDEINDTYSDSWILSMDNAGVIMLGRALSFVPDTDSEIYIRDAIVAPTEINETNGVAGNTIGTTDLAEFSLAEDWLNSATLTAATDAYNTTQFLGNDRSYTLTTVSNDTAVTRIAIGGTLKNDATLWVFVEDQVELDKLSNIRLRFYETFSTDRTDMYIYSAGTTRQAIIPGVWSPLKIYSGIATETNVTWEGNPAGLTFVQMEIQMTRVTDGADVSVSFGLLTSDSADKGGFIWVFDDARDGVFTYAYPLLKSHGWKGVVPIITDNVGDSGTMTEDQLNTLYAAGWDLVSHTVTHADADGLSEEQLLIELEDSHNYLIERGWYRGARMLAWPFNGAVQSSDDWHGIEVARPFYDTIRGVASTSDILNVELTGINDTGNAWTPVSWEQLAYYEFSVNTNDTFADDYEAEFQAIIDKQGVINTYTHQIGDGQTGGNMDLPLLYDTAEWLKAQELAGKLEVITWSDWRERTLGPGGNTSQGVGASPVQVWDATTKILTALDEDDTTIDLDGTATDLSAITGDKNSYKATGFATPANVTDAHSTTDAKIDNTDLLITALAVTVDAIKARWDALTTTGGLLETDMKKLDGTGVKSTNGNIHALPGNI